MEKEILEILGLSIQELEQKARNEKIAIKRHLFCAALYDNNIKVKDIAKRINRNHSTVLNSLKRANNLISISDKLILSDYLRLKEAKLIHLCNNLINNDQ